MTTVFEDLIFNVLLISFKIVFIAWIAITIFTWAQGGKPLETILRAQMDYVIEKAESVRILEK